MKKTDPISLMKVEPLLCKKTMNDSRDVDRQLEAALACYTKTRPQRVLTHVYLVLRSLQEGLGTITLEHTFQRAKWKSSRSLYLEPLEVWSARRRRP